MRRRTRPVKEQIAVLRGQIGGTGAPGGGSLDEGGHRLALVRRKGGDIHKPCYFRIVARFGDHCSPIGVAHENRVPILHCKNPLGNSHIVRQRNRRILDNADVVAVLLKDLLDALPAGAVHKTTMDQNEFFILPSLFRLRQL